MSLREHAARRPVLTYVLLVFGLTWAVWVPRAAAAQGVLDAQWPIVLGSVWTYGPLVAAGLAAALTAGRTGLRTWAARLVRWRVGWRWYVVALAAPAAFWLAVSGVSVLLGQPWLEVRPRALELAPAAGAALLAVLVLTDGIGEEPGWRGFALPALLDRWRPLAASLILGVIWAVWHLPLLVTPGTTLYQTSPVFLLLDLTATSVFYTWLFLRTRYSVLPAVLLHASASLWTAASVPGGTAAQLAIALAGKWLLVVVVVMAGLGPATRAAGTSAEKADEDIP